MSAYYVGFLLGSRRATAMIARVGHVRVFAALGSMISAAFILYAAAPVRLGLDAAAGLRRLLLRRGLRRRRELAQQRRDQRDPRAGAVALHDRADGRDHLGAVPPQPRRPGGLHALRRDVGARLGLLPADPAHRRHRAAVPDDEADVAGPALPHLAARLRRHLPARRRLRGDLRHGLGLRHADGHARRRRSRSSSRRSTRAGSSSSTRSAGCRTGWTGAC